MNEAELIAEGRLRTRCAENAEWICTTCGTSASGTSNPCNTCGSMEFTGSCVRCKAANVVSGERACRSVIQFRERGEIAFPSSRKPAVEPRLIRPSVPRRSPTARFTPPPSSPSTERLPSPPSPPPIPTSSLPKSRILDTIPPPWTVSAGLSAGEKIWFGTKLTWAKVLRLVIIGFILWAFLTVGLIFLAFVLSRLNSPASRPIARVDSQEVKPPSLPKVIPNPSPSEAEPVAAATAMPSKLSDEYIFIKSADGRTIRAKIISISAVAVLVKRDDGQQFDIPFSNLAKETNKLIADYAKSKKAAESPMLQERELIERPIHSNSSNHSLQVVDNHGDAEMKFYSVTGIESRDTLNVRFGPGTNYDILARLPNGAGRIRVVGEPIMNDATEWVQIAFGDRTGWVAKVHLKAE